MRNKFEMGYIGRHALAIASVLALAAMVSSSANAQSDPTASGTAQKPFVMILMDTSASMEWTDEGDEEYPNNNESGVEEWKAGKPLTGVERYGPCYVWEVDDCGHYDRPGWTLDDSWSENYDETPIDGRIDDMTGPDGARLKNGSQPRHVTLKEILTGEMVMYRRDGSGNLPTLGDLSPVNDGPGCWLVPRQYGATREGGSPVCSSDDHKVKEFPDYDDPHPHFQEVFDGQLPNGLMDTVAGNAIFGIAMFDGYKSSKGNPVQDWNAHDAHNLDDSMHETKTFAGLTEGEGDENKDDEWDKYNYNLGIFQMVAPEKLEMGTTISGQISTFVQYALVDAGFLKKDHNPKLKPKDKDNDLATNLAGDAVGVEFSKELKHYIKHDYELGKQPIAKATPLAAAMYDIHEYFAYGTKGKEAKDSPIVKDEYKLCRPKHVIMLTDGQPEPERPPGPDDVDLGIDTLNSAFGYDPDQYPYPLTERAIEYFMNDQVYPSSLSDDPNAGSGSRPTAGTDDSYLAGSWSASGDEFRRAARYNPRVHIVGLTGQVDTSTNASTANLEGQVIKKMAVMAMEGQTCAGYYLGDEWRPDDDPTNPGTCDPDTTYCLDKRQGEFIDARKSASGNSGAYYEFIKPDDPDATPYECRYPALVLSSNSDSANLVSRTSDALQLLFNSIVGGGLASRTSPTYVNELDDPDVLTGGQYRFYSGVSVDIGEIFWRGVLLREERTCTNTGANSSVGSPVVLDVSDEIDDLAGSVGDPDSADGVYDTGSVQDDRRRIFTSFATQNSFDYASRTAQDLSSTGSLSERYRFLFGMDLEQTDTDEFGDTDMDAEPVKLSKRRVPFEFDQLEKAVDNINNDLTDDLVLADYFNVAGDEQLQQLIHEVRGRSEQKEGRAFGAILNGNPVAVEPPNLDLPIDSYRAFKSQYANRLSMVYSATTDGLLHAIYSGELGTSASSDDLVMVRDSSGGESKGSIHEQREAWAYIPQMLHKKLALFKGQQPYMLDGTPTIKDVRLCSKTNDYNLNQQACRCSGSSCMDAVGQWRTVLVEGLGQAGAGYFALDVTRPGGQSPDSATDINMPDPIPLWEFDPNWEYGQVATLAAEDKDLVYPHKTELLDGSDGNFISECDKNTTDDTDGDSFNEYFWAQSFLGGSVGEAAIGTVAIRAKFLDGDRVRRPIAVFSGGLSGEYGNPCDSNERVGRAIYVVDLQTGSLLRRFVSYYDDTGEHRFPAPISGSPALYDSRPGSLATRGFVGDGAGRLYRIDMSDDDPEEWHVELFFNPGEDIPRYASMDENDRPDFGPAGYKPALSLSTSDLNNDLLVFYGLGERGDLSSSGKKQLMIAVRERINATKSGSTYTVSATGEYLWDANLQDTDNDGYSEKLTSAPVVFNRGVYFTTFVEPGDDRCLPGWSRIYGMKFQGGFDTSGNRIAEGLFTENAANADEPTETPIPSGSEGYKPTSVTGNFWAYQPEDPTTLSDPVVVRGLTVTMGASCLSSPQSAVGGTVQNQSKTPTLIAQSSSNKMGDSGSSSAVGGGNGSGSNLYSIEQTLAKPQSQNIPLSWAVVDN